MGFGWSFATNFEDGSLLVTGQLRQQRRGDWTLLADLLDDAKFYGWNVYPN